MREQIGRILAAHGYRFLPSRPEEAGIFYKYHRGIYQVVLAVDDRTSMELTVPKLQSMITHVTQVFYRPENVIADHDPEETVYRVDVMTIVFGYQPDAMHILCANVDNVWAYDMTCGNLIIYENQPGDFDVLRSDMENLQYGKMPEHMSKQQDTQKEMSEKIRAISIRWGVTAVLIAVNIFIFLVLEMMGSTEDADFMLCHGASYPVNVFASGEYWRLFTAIFLHFGLMHLLNNMVMLGCAGAKVEEAIGHGKYLLLYLAAGISGNILSLFEMIRTGEYAVAAGASGAIFGVIGALLWIVIHNRGRYDSLTTKGMVIMIALCLYYGITTANVDNWAHLGGLLIGFVLCMVLYRKRG